MTIPHMESEIILFSIIQNALYLLPINNTISIIDEINVETAILNLSERDGLIDELAIAIYKSGASNNIVVSITGLAHLTLHNSFINAFITIVVTKM